MLYRIRDFDMPSMGAIAVELQYMVPLLRLLRRFDRIAVVADAGWVRRMSEIEGALFPGIELKAFDPAHAAEAEAWLGKEPARTRSPEAEGLTRAHMRESRAPLDQVRGYPVTKLGCRCAFLQSSRRKPGPNSKLPLPSEVRGN